MALKDIINSGKYGDDMVLSLPDGTTATVGEIRSLPAEERQSLVDRQNLVSQAEMALAGKVQEAVRAGWLTQDGKIVAPTLPRNDKEIRQAAASEFGLSEDDPLLGAVVKEFKAELSKRDQQFKTMQEEMKNALGTVTNVVKTSVGRYLDERYRNDFAAATKELPSSVKVDFQKAYEFAEQNGLKDKDGVLRIPDAVKMMTFDDILKARTAAAKEEGLQEGQKRAALANVNRPRTASPEHHREKSDFNPYNERTDANGHKVRQVKSFDEVLAEAQNDDELMKSALATASFGVVQ